VSQRRLFAQSAVSRRASSDVPRPTASRRRTSVNTSTVRRQVRRRRRRSCSLLQVCRCSVSAKFHYTDPTRPDYVRGLVGDPHGPNRLCRRLTKSGRAHLVEVALLLALDSFLCVCKGLARILYVFLLC